MYNINSGYGLMTAANIKDLGPGKNFMVGAAGVAGIDMLKNLFGVDPDGINRYAATLDACIGYTTASRGDNIFIAPGHTESLTAAAAIAMDVAGVKVFGLGTGNNRPVFTFASTDNSATWTISGDNCALKNVVLVCNDDGLTNALVVTGNNCDIDIEFQDTSAAIEAATAVRLDTADNCKLKIKYNGFIAGNATVRAIAVDDCDNVRIDVDFYGVVTTAVVNFVDALSTNVHVTGRMYTSGTTNFSKTVVDTIGSSIWTADFLDATANVGVSGGNVAALASDDVAGVAALVTTLQTSVDTLDNIIDTEFPVVATAVGAVADAAVADTVEGAAMSTQSILSDIKAVAQRIGADNANNTAATTVVVADKDGSIFERLEAVQLAQAPSKNHPNYFTVTADMTSATWNTAAAHEIATVTGVVRMQILVETTATVITTGTNGTIALGYEGNTSAIFSATALDAALTGDVFSAVYGAAATTVASGADANSALTHSIFDVVVVGGLDVGYTIATNAATTGSLVFHVWWEPLSATGAVTAGAGGAL